MKFLVEIPDREISGTFAENQAERARAEISDAIDGDTQFIVAKVTIADEVTALAFSIADESAISTVECVSVPEGKWLRIDEDDEESVSDEIRYLTLRGLLMRNDGQPGLIRLREEGGVA
jgi:hypothetical protein